MLPQEPVMLLSYVNTKLRNEDSSLEEFCLREGADLEEVLQKLASIDYHYQEERNQFQ